MNTAPRTPNRYLRHLQSFFLDQWRRRGVKAHTLALFVAAVLIGFAPPEAKAGCSDPPGPRVDWSKCHKEHTIIREQNFSGARLDYVHLNYSDLFGSNFSHASFVGAFLIRSRLAAAKLVGANLLEAVLIRANLADADLTEADLSKAELSRADMHGANLEGASLRDANISRVNFIGANLTGSHIDGAYTLLTRFEGVDLAGVKGFTQNQLDIACGNDETALPPGFKRPGQWPCPAEGN